MAYAAILDRRMPKAGGTPIKPGHRLGRLFPGLALCVLVAAAAMALDHVETALLGRAWLEALVLAILLGTIIRTCWMPGRRWTLGIGFGAKTLLEIAVVLLGASISTAAILEAGWGLLGGIAAVVAVALPASYGLGRLLRLPHRMAVLIACGNSICGNSAIAAVAPVIGADGEEVAASIAFTAVLGVVVVLCLPLLVPLLHLSGLQYGVLAGLTVYAVPQVLAATAPIGVVAVQIGTLVKLVRVLMLGPVVLVLALLTRPMGEGTDDASPPIAAGRRPKAGWPPVQKLVPWFIVGFLALAAIRSVGFIPAVALPPIAATANILTVVAMAALGLGTDLKIVAKAGGRVSLTVASSLLVLGGISLALISLLGIV